MGKKSNDMIVMYSDSDDSLELINPVTNLSLEHIEKRKCVEELNYESNKLENLHLNESNKYEKKILQKKKIKNQSRHHPYLHSKNKPKIKYENCEQDYNMEFLKSLGYIEYTSSKTCKNVQIRSQSIQSLYLQLNYSLKQTFSKYMQTIDQDKPNHYICNRRFH